MAIPSKNRPPPVVGLPRNTKTPANVVALAGVQPAFGKADKFPMSGNLDLMNSTNSHGIPRGSRLERTFHQLTRCIPTGNEFAARCASTGALLFRFRHGLPHLFVTLSSKA